jgi:hypothetical protein
MLQHTQTNKRGIMHDDVQSSETLDGDLDELRTGLLAPDIAQMKGCYPAARAYPGDDFFTGSGASGIYNNASSLAREPLNDSATNALTSAGDDCNATF